MPLEPTTFALRALTTVGTAVWTAWQRRRIDEKRQILIKELSAGRLHLMHAIDRDELFACIHRFDRAAIEGSAHYKLQLMARVLRGQIEGGCLIADEFATFADIIASLREPELKYVSALYSSEQAITGDPAAEENEKKIWQTVTTKLVPRTFPNTAEMNAAATALQRTGLVMGGRAFLDGGVFFRTSPLMKVFATLAGLEPQPEMKKGRTEPTL